MLNVLITNFDIHMDDNYYIIHNSIVIKNIWKSSAKDIDDHVHSTSD